MRGGEEAGGNALRNILSSIFAEQGGDRSSSPSSVKTAGLPFELPMVSQWCERSNLVHCIGYSIPAGFVRVEAGRPQKYSSTASPSSLPSTGSSTHTPPAIC